MAEGIREHTSQLLYKAAMESTSLGPLAMVNAKHCRFGVFTGVETLRIQISLQDDLKACPWSTHLYDSRHNICCWEVMWHFHVDSRILTALIPIY